MIKGIICSPIRIICTLLTLVILAIAIIAGILAATFKMPDISLTGVSLDAAPLTSATNGGINFNWIVSVAVKNNWRYDIYLSTIDVSGALISAPASEVAKGSKNEVNLPSYTPVTIDIKMASTLSGGNTEGAVNLIQTLSSCAGGKIPVVYNLDLGVKVWGIGPIKIPRITKTTDAPCPNANSAIKSATNVLGAMLQGPSTVAAAQNVANNPQALSTLQGIVANNGVAGVNNAVNALS